MFNRAAVILAIALLSVDSLCAESATADKDSDSAQFFDDGAFRRLQTDQARTLKSKGHLVSVRALAKQLKRKTTKLSLGKSSSDSLSQKEIFRKCSKSVFSLAEVRICDGCGQVHVTPYGTGFAITADGVLLTNRHLIEQLGPDSELVASTADGTTYPVVELLASSEKDDAAAVRIDGVGFKPLALSTDNFVGTRISVISHPRGHLFSFSEGIVTRLLTQFSARRMLISAEYAVGSSGGPVLDSNGNVVGMVASAANLNEQMMTRLCIPSQSLLELITDSKFSTQREIHDPHATERTCLKDTFAAMQQLGQMQGTLTPKEFNERLTALHAVMMNALKLCPDDAVAKHYLKVIQSLKSEKTNATQAPRSK